MSISCSRRAGFTLVELLVVLAIMAVLSAIAYPSYTRYVERARRSAARAVLLEASQFMERYYAARNSYLDTSQNPPLAPALPDRLKYAPAGVAQADAAYTVTIDSATASEYTLRAEPTRADGCGNLTLDATGARGRSGTGLTVEACWR